MADLDVRTLFDENVSRVTCPRCGTFEITGKAWSAFDRYLSPELEENRYLLSGRARAATLNGEVVRLDMEDLGQAERGEMTEPGVDEKVRLMLRWFERNSKRFGQPLTPVSATDYPAAYCRDEHEWTALIHALVEKKLLHHDGGLQYSIALSGREKLAELQTKGLAEQDYWSTYPEADLDALTKLMIRRRFDVDLERSFAEASEISPVALLSSTSTTSRRSTTSTEGMRKAIGCCVA